MTNGIYILLGSNLGDKKKNLQRATNFINWHLGDILKISKIYETAAWGKTDQPSFYNQVVAIRSTIKSQEMLKIINQIEEQMGRIRKEKWGERLIDIDILYYGREVVDQKDLQIPHPGIPERRFTLIPLVEIAPDFIHPILNQDNTSLLKACVDDLKVTTIE